jgi:serine/threonine protein phosphatase PrpC
MNIRNIYINSNYRETISANYINDNIINENKNNQKETEEELLNKKGEQMNELNAKNNIENNTNIYDTNNNNIYFKSYFSHTIAGKNYGVVKKNQDMPVAVININGIKGFNIFCVLDGHGLNGHHVSKFMCEYLIKRIINLKEISSIKDLDTIYQVLIKSNYELIINIFLESDQVLSKQKFDISLSGTTCVLVIQIGKNLICANVGDSRAILIYDTLNDKNLKNTEIFELSHDCKPDLPEEKERIIRNGGTVDQMLDMNGNRGGPQRVWAKNKNYPGLAMSRSLGDLKGKECGIISEPKIIEYTLEEKSKFKKNVQVVFGNFYLIKMLWKLQ